MVSSERTGMEGKAKAERDSLTQAEEEDTSVQAYCADSFRELATANVSTIQNKLLRLTINDSMIATGTIVTARVFCTKKLRCVQFFCFDPSAEIFALLTEAPAMTGNSALELIRSSKMSGSRAP